MNSRAKGKRGELRGVEVLRPWWPEAHRSASQGAGGQVAPDVEGTPLWVEVKEGARPNLWAALDQALADSKGRRPCLVLAHRTSGARAARTVVVISADQLDQVLRAFRGES